ncbi:hypothetical protein PUNSTDRAFT_131307, partial [Punctularia strigosozonata HHB-11173 SS5]|uniref:uncharacterized protein n=1 Tax=Punctularia strigosozonata (strain HHB-11173) TaxID=741275 RepID=UPI00044175E4
MSAVKPQRSLTPAEVNKIKRCAEAIRAGQDSFSCGGVLTSKDIDVDQLYLKYTDSSQPDQSFTTRPVPLTEEIIGKLARAGNIAPFGKGSETVVDESYRLARAIAIPDFALVPDPTSSSGLLTTIAAHLGLKYPLTARLAKLNIYPQGGFFKAHQDTARGENHLGTITLCLPSSFTGGDLVVRKGDREIVYDWSTDVWGASGNPQLPWAFLYADVEHEVLPVTSGMRVTAAWDVFTIPDSGTQISYD